MVRLPPLSAGSHTCYGNVLCGMEHKSIIFLLHRYQIAVEFLSDKIVCDCKSKTFRNLYLVYLLTGIMKAKPKSKSKPKSKPKPVKKPKTKKEKPLDSKSSPTVKPTFRTVTETLSKGGTPFLKRKKRVRVDKK